MHSNNISTTTTTTTVTLTATTAIIIYNTVIISGRFYPLDECQAAQSERVSFAVNSDCTASQPVVSRSPLFRFRRPHFAAVTLCRGIAVHGITADRAREQGDLIAGYRVTATAALIGTLLSLFIVENSSGTPLLSLTLASRRPGLSLERCGFMSIVKLQRVFTVRTDIQ